VVSEVYKSPADVIREAIALARGKNDYLAMGELAMKLAQIETRYS